MNDFLQQFLIESRDYLDQASNGLLILEQTPHDSRALDDVFRAFHTLKGGAGIVEFAAMERAVHAAEDILAAARTGKQPLTVALVGDCLVCLDQVAQWLDSLEATGELPADGTEQADKIAVRLRASAGAAEDTQPAGPQAGIPDWVENLLERNSQVRGSATTAIRVIPDPDCFLQAQDPLERLTSLPGLLALDVQPARPWPPLTSFDPFTCNLVLTGLTASSAPDVSAHLRGVSGDCEILSIASREFAPENSSLPDRVRAILEAQTALISGGSPENRVGRLASAGLTAANALRHCGRLEQAATVARATEHSIEQLAPMPLQDAIAQCLAQGSTQQPEQPVASPVSAPRAEPATRLLRVDAARIDALVRLTGELTVAKNALNHVVKLARADGNSLAGVLNDRQVVFEHLVAELQRSVLGMRVLPLRSVLQRFPRAVREMAADLGKAVRLEIAGEDTEADKAIVEMLFEPLLHIVRNAVDHGVEHAQDRVQRGKPALATIQVHARRQGDQVLVEVSDDGGGVDVARVREVAQDRHVVTEEDLRAMSDADVIDLIFAPGFSTAAKVTELSGRGVGMDAVRTAVERVGGRVSIESRAGKGTTVRFLLPFSVMMTQVMTLEAGGQMFGLPLDAIVETVRVPAEKIAHIGAAQAIVLRNRTIPLFDLAKVLGAAYPINEGADALIVITTFAGQLGGVRIDRLGERIDAILKPLDGLLAGTPGITGTTLLGDGRVLLVLDIGEMLQ